MPNRTLFSGSTHGTVRSVENLERRRSVNPAECSLGGVAGWKVSLGGALNLIDRFVSITLVSCQVRTYVVDIAGGTATASVQMQGKQTFQGIAFNGVSAAAGSYEISTSATSQIGTAQPTQDVVARFRISATAGGFQTVIPLKLAVVAFQTLYIHCTGAGNVGEVILF